MHIFKLHLFFIRTPNFWPILDVLIFSAISASDILMDVFKYLIKTRTAGFIRCDYLVVTYCSFLFIFVFDGGTD